MSPAEFVPVAEEIGLIRRINRWMLREACAQMAEWRARFPDAELGASVNTSAREFDDPDFLPQSEAVLAEHRLPPRSLELEITGSIFLDPDPRIGGIIAAVRAHGVRVGLDDFGTGYSSLSYLKRSADGRDRSSGARVLGSPPLRSRRGRRGAEPACRRRVRSLDPGPELG